MLGTAKLICSTLANAKLVGRPVVAQSRPCAAGAGRRQRLGRALSRLGPCGEAKGPLVALDRQGRAVGRPGRRARRPQGPGRARRQLGAGQGAVVAQRLADPAAALRGRARWAVALRRPAARGAARRRLDARSGGLGARRPGRQCRRCGRRCWCRSAPCWPRPAPRACGRPNGIVGSAALAPILTTMLDQPQLPVAQRTNPERSFKEEVRSLRLGDGEIFRGEGILAVTKAILQSGVSYVGGYQGAPVSHLVDVLVEIAGPARRARRPSRDLHQRSVGRRACSAPRSTIRCAAASPGSRSSAPTWRPMRSPTSPRPA